MAITATQGASKTATLATTLQRVESPDGLPLTGQLLYISWPSASQATTNQVRIRYGAGDDGDAVATDDDTIYPGTSYSRVIDIRGCASVAVAGTSAFAITIRIVN